MSGKLKKILTGRKKKVLRIGVVFLCLALVAAALFKFDVIKLESKTVSTQQLRTARVTRGNIVISVSGSGSVVSSDKVQLSPEVTGSISKIYFKEGDTVKKGELLFELDDTEAKLKRDAIKNSIAQAQLTASNTQKNVDSLNVKAPFDGKVTKIEPDVGDVISRNANVLTITDVSKLKVTLPFSASVVKAISAGQKVSVYIQDIMHSVEGSVSYIGNNSYATALGGEVYDVEIIISNPGFLKEGMTATAEFDTSDGSVPSSDAAKTQYINSDIVKCDAGGTVKAINIRENDYVKAGDILVVVDNDELAITQETNNIKLQELNSQLEAAEKALADYKIYSPIDGVIVTQDVIVGDQAKPGTVLTTISDVNHMEFDVSIDELDIEKIKLGQKVNITADALTETTNNVLTGEVIKIAAEGTATNGVTVFPVTIKINETGKLRVGMNVNAEILVSEKTGVLRVPLEAVTKFNDIGMVWVRGSVQNGGDTPGQEENSEGRGQSGPRNGFAGQNGRPNMPQQGGTSDGSQRGGADSRQRANMPNSEYYKDAVRKTVELGINNDEYIEVISGLSEGEEVILPPLATSTGSTTRGTQQIGGMGMMGGGMMRGGMMGGMGNPGGPGFPGGSGGQMTRNRTQNNTGNNNSSSNRTGNSPMQGGGQRN
jgi:HlyD family secretion protein